MARSRADRIKMEERIAACIEFIGKGMDRNACVDALSQRFGVLGLRQVDRYRKMAMDRLIEESKIDNQENMDKALGKMNGKLKYLYKKAIEKDDIKLGLDIATTEGKLNSVFNQTLIIKNEDSELQEVSSDDLLKLLSSDVSKESVS
jgi:hypothetical protein